MRKMYPDLFYICTPGMRMKVKKAIILPLGMGFQEIPSRVGSPEHPNYGSWGGRYEYYTPRTQPYFFEPETRPLWTNADDEVFSETDNRDYTGNHATIWRWREAYQHDFAARMDWCVNSFEEANHPPVPGLGHEDVLNVTEGDVDYAVSKLRIYAIADQDNTSKWIRKTYPEVFQRR